MHRWPENLKWHRLSLFILSKWNMFTRGGGINHLYPKKKGTNSAFLKRMESCTGLATWPWFCCRAFASSASHHARCSARSRAISASRVASAVPSLFLVTASGAMFSAASAALSAAGSVTGRPHTSYDTCLKHHHSQIQPHACASMHFVLLLTSGFRMSTPQSLLSWN